MDDHTFLLLQQLDRKLQSTELSIQRQRSNFTRLAPCFRAVCECELNRLIEELVRLRKYRHALLTPLSYDYLN